MQAARRRRRSRARRAKSTESTWLRAALRRRSCRRRRGAVFHPARPVWWATGEQRRWWSSRSRSNQPDPRGSRARVPSSFPPWPARVPSSFPPRPLGPSRRGPPRLPRPHASHPHRHPGRRCVGLGRRPRPGQRCHRLCCWHCRRPPVLLRQRGDPPAVHAPVAGRAPHLPCPATGRRWPGAARHPGRPGGRAGRAGARLPARVGDGPWVVGGARGCCDSGRDCGGRHREWVVNTLPGDGVLGRDGPAVGAGRGQPALGAGHHLPTNPARHAAAAALLTRGRPARCVGSCRGRDA